VCLLVLGISSTAHAQRGHGHVGGPVVVASPFFYPYYDPFFWGFYPWGPGPYPFYGPIVDGSAARRQVTPPETEVYVDGYLVGKVDDFDGLAQRLHLPPGEHVVELYLEGYKIVSQSIFFQPGETYRIRHTMEALASGEAQPARPKPREGAAPPYPASDAFGRPTGPPAPGQPEAAAGNQTSGMLAIRVQPADAVVLIDGERWETSGSGPLRVQVTPGSHRVEVQKDGYQTFTTTVQVPAGGPTPLNVSLTPRS
jgi:hypothetical protein